MDKLPISLVVIALNEEHNIQRCLDSVPFASEKLVVDSFSSDRTVEVAQSAGARVIQEKWRGFGAQKAFATENAVNDWIISLDADEALSPELQNEIKEIFAKLDHETGYLIPRLSYHLGRWIRRGGWYPDLQLRLFHRKYCQWNQASLHEKIQIKNQKKLNSPIHHWVFEDLADQVNTNNRYSGLGTQELIQRQESFSLLKLIFRPFGKFIECYFVKLGFLDGMPGVIIAIGAAYSLFLRYAKLWEYQFVKKGQ